MKLYIAGPMTGIPDKNMPLFWRAEKILQNRGYEVRNPARHEATPGMKWSWYMRHAIRDVCDVDGIALLEGWESSRGAQLEVKVAEALGLQIKLWTRWEIC